MPSGCGEHAPTKRCEGRTFARDARRSLYLAPRGAFPAKRGHRALHPHAKPTAAFRRTKLA